MNVMKTNTSFAATVAFLLSLASLSAMASPTPVALTGDAAPSSYATRTVNIDPNTKYVNVKGHDVVQFVAANGKSVTWSFDNPATYAMKLSTIMPAGGLDHEVMVYVDHNMLYDKHE